MKLAKLITYKGLTMTAEEWADKLRIHKTSLYARIRRYGVTEKAMTSGQLVKGTEAVKVSVYGEDMTPQQVADIFELHSGTVRRWLNDGKNVEEQIEKVKERNAKKFDTD